MPLPITTIVVGAVGTAVATFFQNHSAKLRSQRDLKLSELQEARRISDAVSISLDTLAYLSTETMFGLLVCREREGSPEEIQEKLEEWEAEDRKHWQEYRSAWSEWCKNKTRTRAAVSRYFGDKATALLEDAQKDLEKLNDQLTATHFERVDNPSYLFDKEGKPDYPKFFKFKGSLEKKLVQFNEVMLTMIQKQTVGILGVRKA